MTEQPMHAYAVSLVFGNGPIVANVVVAPSPEAAAALILHSFMRVVQPKEELSGVAVVPIAPEWLSRAKDAVEGKERGQVLHLVPSPEPDISRDQLLEARAAEAQMADGPRQNQTPWVNISQIGGGSGRQPEGYCARHPLHPTRDGICPLCQGNQRHLWNIPSHLGEPRRCTLCKLWETRTTDDLAPCRGAPEDVA